MRRTPLHEILDLDELRRGQEARLIGLQTHPTEPLAILNYTAAAAYTRAWNPTVRACRGLVFDETDGRVVSRPFAKFFNWGEHGSEDGVVEGLPEGPATEAYEKLDGSLGISYHRPSDGSVGIATRGSFTSDQARHASQLWREKYHDVAIPFGQTWLFEIIYPENRIVVNYGRFDDLVLLAVIDNATGADLPLSAAVGWHGPRVRRFPSTDLGELRGLVKDDGDNEGFVFRYHREGAPSVRVKWKLEEYVRLHRIVTRVSSKTIWEHLSQGLPLNDLLERVPDEFFDWVRREERRLVSAFDRIVEDARDEHSAVTRGLGPGYTRAELAERVKADCRHRSLVFALEDGKDVSPQVWRAVKPAYEVPFRVDDDA